MLTVIHLIRQQRPSGDTMQCLVLWIGQDLSVSFLSDTLTGLMAWRWCIGSTSKRETSPTAADSCAATPTSTTWKRTGLWCRSLGHWPRPIPARTSSRAFSHAFRLKVSVLTYSIFPCVRHNIRFLLGSRGWMHFLVYWVFSITRAGVAFYCFVFYCAERSMSQYCWVCFL